MFTKKTTVVTSTGKLSGKLSKSVDDLMAKGSEMLDAGMKVMHEAFKETGTDEAVSTTIRIRLTAQQIADLQVNRTLTFKAEGVTILLERGEK